MMRKFDTETWAHARAWTLWKALTYITSNQTDINIEAKQAWHIIDEVLADQKLT